METKTIDIVVGAFSPRTYGIKAADDTWYNLEAKADPKVAENVRKGCEVRLTLVDNFKYSDVQILSEPQGDDEIVGIDELLARAHKEFKHLSITTELMKSEPWLFKATVQFIKEDNVVHIFTGHGDATQENVQGDIGKALPRMAETRAIARALRFALGTGVTKEELPGKKEEVKKEISEPDLYV